MPPGPGQDPQLPPPQFQQPQYAPLEHYPPAPVPPPQKNWAARHKVLTALGVVVVVSAMGSAAGANKKDANKLQAVTGTTVAQSTSTGLPNASGPSTSAASTPPAPKEPATPSATSTPKAPTSTKPAPPTPKPDPTTEKAANSFSTAQENAIRSAQDYLSMGGGFSRQGLIDQLSSDFADGYSKHDATVAVDSLHIDFNEQAVLAGKAYLDMTGFSRKGLIDQLSSSYGSQFTVAQATYAAKKLGL